MLGSNTLDGEQVLFVLGEKSSTSMTGTFPLGLPHFTAAFLNGDISSLHHVIDEKRNTIQETLLAMG